MPSATRTVRPDLDRPPLEPVLVDVPDTTYLMIDGSGGPGGPEHATALTALFSVAYPIVIGLRRASRAEDGILRRSPSASAAREARGARRPAGLHASLAVGPLEGLWWLASEAYHGFDPRRSDRSDWRWTAMLRWPDDVPEVVRDEAFSRAARKVGEETASRLRIEPLSEGRCAQMLHQGPYADEAPNIAHLHAFIEDQGMQPRGRHHEIYLTDARRTAPERMRTVIRQPVR